MAELTGGRGVDVSFEVIGLKATVQQALAMARRGGQAIIVGVPKMEQTMEIPIAMELLVNEKQVPRLVVRIVERAARRPAAHRPLQERHA